jgi:CRP/FNR family transcriptional regulator, cyclic AMP receptor protein
MSTQVHVFDTATDFEQYPTGHAIFSQGDRGDKMYAVKDGVVDIMYNDTVVETVTAGGIFGEMALVDDSPRSASAIVRADCKVVPVDQKRFIFMLQNTPFFAITVMTIMSERIRKLDQIVMGANK